MTSALLLAVLLQAVPQKETISVPGTKTSFEILRVPGDGKMRPFWIATKEATWGEFRPYQQGRDKGADAVTRPSDTSYIRAMGIPEDALEVGRPVITPRWHTAVGYCGWLSRKTGRYFRLPTEKEWEYAARAGDRGARPERLDDLAWHLGNGGKRAHAGGE